MRFDEARFHVAHSLEVRFHEARFHVARQSAAAAGWHAVQAAALPGALPKLPDVPHYGLPWNCWDEEQQRYSGEGYFRAPADEEHCSDVRYFHYSPVSPVRSRSCGPEAVTPDVLHCAQPSCCWDEELRHCAAQSRELAVAAPYCSDAERSHSCWDAERSHDSPAAHSRCWRCWAEH